MADRLLLWLVDVIQRCVNLLSHNLCRHGITVEQLAILGSARVSPLLIDRFIRHVENRACTTVVWGHQLEEDLIHVRAVDSASEMPRDIQVVVALDGETPSREMDAWARQVKNARFISLEKPRAGVAPKRVCVERWMSNCCLVSHSDAGRRDGGRGRGRSGDGCR